MISDKILKFGANIFEKLLFVNYFLLILLILIFILIARYFQIQVISFDAYSKKSNTNRIRKITTNAPRGLILDRNGEILVDNNPTYVLTAIPGELSQKGEKFGLISNIKASFSGEYSSLIYVFEKESSFLED